MHFFQIDGSRRSVTEGLRASLEVQQCRALEHEKSLAELDRSESALGVSALVHVSAVIALDLFQVCRVELNRGKQRGEENGK